MVNTVQHVQQPAAKEPLDDLAAIDPINYYSTMQLDPPLFNHAAQIVVNNRMAVIGRSGSLKTNTVVSYARQVLKLESLQRVICVAPELNQNPLYGQLQLDLKQQHKESHFSDDLNVLCRQNCRDKHCARLHLRDIDPAAGTTLLILDDLAGHTVQELAKIDHWITNSRVHGVSVCILSQSYTQIPLLWRQQLQYVLVKTMLTVDLRRLLEHNKEDVPRVLALYNRIQQNGQPQDFMLIARVTRDAARYRYRHNWRPQC